MITRVRRGNPASPRRVAVLDELEVSYERVGGGLQLMQSVSYRLS